MSKKDVFKKMLIEKEMRIEFMSDGDDDDDIFGGGELVKLSQDEINEAKKICLAAADKISDGQAKGKNFARVVAKMVDEENAKMVAEKLAFDFDYVKADFEEDK